MTQRERQERRESFLAAIGQGGIPDKDVPEMQLLNTFSRHPYTRPAFHALRDIVERWADRVLLAEIAGADLTVWRAVLARTFGFSKLAERICLERLREGYVDPEKPGHAKMLDSDGLPLFLGCKGAKKTIMAKSLTRLQEKGLIARLDVRRRSVPMVFLAPLPPLLMVAAIVGASIRADEDLTLEQRAAMYRVACRARDSLPSGWTDQSETPAIGHLLNAHFFTDALAHWNRISVDYRAAKSTERAAA